MGVSLLRFRRPVRPLALLLLAPMLMAATSLAPLRQIAILDLPGRPGFDEVALVRGMILVSHGAAGTVDLFDAQKRRIVGHIREMSSPRGVAYDAASHLVYIANSGANSIVVVSSEDWQVRHIINTAAGPDALLLVPSEHLLYATFPDSQTVMAFDTAASDSAPEAGPGAVEVSHVTLDGRPAGMAFDSSRRHLLVTVQDRRRILVLNPALKEEARMELNASEPAGIVYSRKNDRVYVAVRYAVLALDAATGQEVSRAAAAGGIEQIVLDEAANSLLALAHGSVFVIPAGATLGASGEMPVDVKGHTMAYDPATGYLYLPGGREGRSKLLILKRTAAR